MSVTTQPIGPKPTIAGTPWREHAEEALIPPLVALLVALICGDLLILSYGQSPAAVYRLLLEGTWGNAYGFGQVLYKATTLAFTGLAVSFGLRAGLFNIGGESQLAAGGFAAALTGLALPVGTPLILALPLCMIAAGLAGGVVGSVPAYLKTRFGAHEVIVTIMLNRRRSTLLRSTPAFCRVLRTSIPDFTAPPLISRSSWQFSSLSSSGSTCFVGAAATSCARWVCSRKPPSTGESAWGESGCARSRSQV